MGEKEAVYCLCCEQMRSVREVKYIFRTGFYRSAFPMGWCTQCGTHSGGHKLRMS